MKTYYTFAGAQRAANGKPVLRILSDPEELWVILPSLAADVMVYTSESPSSGLRFAGSCKARDIATMQEN